MGERLQREGTYVHRWLIHVNVRQKPTQYCNYPQLKINLKNVKYIFIKKTHPQDFAGTLVVGTLLSNVGGVGSIPGVGSHLP